VLMALMDVFNADGQLGKRYATFARGTRSGAASAVLARAQRRCAHAPVCQAMPYAAPLKLNP